MLRKNPYGLRLIRGSGQRASERRYAPAARAAGSRGETSGAYAASRHRRDDLAIALRAMEERLDAMREDRGRIARDLHDSVLQSLYAIGLSIETARRGGPAGAATGENRRGTMVVDQLNHLILEVRGLIQSLESDQVRGFDLGSELHSLIQTYKQISPLKISANIAPDVTGLVTNEEKREVLMIVREAISNCVRHAKAAHAAVSLYVRGSRLRLLVSDDGIGFAQEQRQAKGYGLANMSARATKLGGRLSVRSQVGKGTRILVEFSLEPDLSAV